MTDPILDEVRKNRDDHARKFDYDLERICEDLRSKHAQNIERLVAVKDAGAPPEACAASE